MPSAIIFDVDGTLVDSVDLHALAWADAFAEYGHDVAPEAVRSQIGKGGDQLMPVYLDPAELDRIGPALESRRAAILKERYLHRVAGFPDVRALFERLLADGKRIVLASSAKDDELEFYKQTANIADLVDEQTSADDAEHSKPEPDIFLAAMARLGHPGPDQVIVVGDSPYDAEAAGKAGLRTIGLLSGGFSEIDLREAGCIDIYDDPADLLHRYAQSPLS